MVFVNRLAFNVKLPLTDIVLAHTGEPQRGDIVTFSSPKDGKRLIKRLIALPGDTVEMRDERLVINAAPDLTPAASRCAKKLRRAGGAAQSLSDAGR
ncbi:peptidase S24-like family protein [Janthinobacterium agaricidamnosum NBRC 102515 = DSM 9628]|uniref:Signal peptidase I n=1 Tax=Janthinobacterium agaricidamnosum NBRC 102515 = DSM 9628 TaxID=1349767 RepID=W0V0Q5_9BURK|nr:peptidase S24-like family protein [Janthinobacterium agaricidamnosum NBRC 102515 = DSM 9628]